MAMHDFEPLAACERRAKISVALAREATRIAAALLRDDDDPRAIDDHQKRIRYLAFAALRRLEPKGRSIEQAELAGFGAAEAMRAYGRLKEMRERARGSRLGHWLRADREIAIAEALMALRIDANRAAAAQEEAEASLRRAPRIVRRDGAAKLPGLRFLSRPAARSAAQMLGDPPPGRSALDRREAGR